MPGRNDEPLEDAFWAVARRLRHGTVHTLAPYDITPGHFRALGVLMRHGPVRLGDLSERLRIAPRSTTEVVDALEARGLVARHPDPDDRRATLVEVSAEGNRLNDAIRSARRHEAQKLFGALSARDRADLARILRKLTD